MDYEWSSDRRVERESLVFRHLKAQRKGDIESKGFKSKEIEKTITLMMSFAHAR